MSFSLLALAAQLNATDVWSGPSFAADPAALRQAATAVKPEKNSEATLLLNDVHYSFDESGKAIETRHLIYRIENQDGVKEWAEVSGRWEAWHQAKPEIKARTITLEGAVHWLDPKTLSDVPVHEDAPDMYSDERRYGGPLPAVAPGAIIEQEVVVRDTATFFAGGTVNRQAFAWGTPVNATHFVITHPVSLPVHYQLHLLPEASVTKSTENAVETITLNIGPLAAYTERIEYVPADVVLYPEIEFSTGTSWQQVAAEYARLSNDRLRPADVQPLLARINLKGASRQEAIRDIVAALHKNVRYTGVEFGESSLVPQFPSETLKRKYGDCKDKAALLVTMLRSAGIPASLALLDSGPGRDINKELPGMGMFDHAIAYVPASGADPELWIDATAQYSQVGSLPWMDYGRWALVANEKTDSLRQIPELTSGQNVHRELREFTLAEYGLARIVETDDEMGPAEADNREYYNGDSKKVKENSDRYVKDMYLADSLISLEHGDLSNLEKPAAIKFVTKGRRGNTDLTSAGMAIRVEALFGSLPEYFRTKEDEQEGDADKDKSEKPKPRTADWRILPFTTEWKYKITAPLGFKLRATPSDRDDKVGGLNFTQKYSANPEGTMVEAILRVENPQSRLTVQQAKELRDAVLKARGTDPVFITFDQVGHALLSAGKIKEGLLSYQQVAAQHPKEALHKAQLAQALLTVGLAEQARSVAKEGTTLDPSSAVAFSTLGTVLQHDLIGRPLKKGMDYTGAVAAYRRAKTLDPKDKEIRASLAVLLEYDAEGTRYGETAPLKEAVAELRELKKLDEEYGGKYDDNILYDLWYVHDYKGVLDCVATLPSTEVRKSFALAALAAEQGSNAALKKSMEITTDDQGRGKVLVTAGALLIRVRRYAEGSAMFAAGAVGQSNESQLAQSAALFGKTKPYSEIQIDRADPRSPVQRLFGGMASGNLKMEEFKSLMSTSLINSGESIEESQFRQMMSQSKSQMGSVGLPLNVIADLAISNMHYTVEGDDSFGYKIILEVPSATAQDWYVVREGSGYRIADFPISRSGLPEQLAIPAMQYLEENKLAAARKWLDWARDKIHINGDDDPLSGQPFPHFWTKGQESDAATIRTAALVLLPSSKLKGTHLTELIHARDAAKNDPERMRLTLALANAYAAQLHWAELLPAAEELMKSSPDSVRAFDLAATAYKGLKRFEEWEKLVQARLLKHPDELAYVRSSAELEEFRGQFAKSRQILKALIDKGRATERDLNSYAWSALLLSGPVDQEAIDAAQRANELTKGSNFAILHTLGCLYAEAGKTGQARELLLKAMDAVHMEEPDSEVWFGFAKIAEQYGDLSAAQTIYSRVEKPKIDYPGTSYVMAQQRLSALHNGGESMAKTSGQ